MKTAFILFYILVGSSGEDLFQTKAYSDLGECEYQRQIFKHEGYIVGDKCLKINYSIDHSTDHQPK